MSGMKWEIIVVAIFCAVSVKSVPLEEKRKISLSQSQNLLKNEDFATRHNLIKPAPQPFYPSYNDFRMINRNQAKLDEEKLSYRLPNDSIPIRYDLWLKTDVDKANFNFQGRVKIHIKIVTSNTQNITLHYRQITIDNIDLLDVNHNPLQSNLIFNYISNVDFLVITLPTAYPMDLVDEVVLDIKYHGILRDDYSGFYRAGYLDNEVGGEKIWFATTQFEQTDARHAMPCYDEPGIRAIVNINIQHDKNYTAISNMPIIDREIVPGTEYVISKFQDTPRLQTYLLAFIISDYTFVSNNDVNVEQRVYAKPQLIDNGEGDYALSMVGPVLRKLEEHLGVDFPLSKMDHAAVADYIWGAMENFGLITYAEDGLKYNPKTDPVYVKKNILELIAHEYAHQWFGNIVNPAWWNYLWLNEGFASFLQYYIPSLMYPEEDYMERMMIYGLEAAFASDNGNAPPMNLYVESPADINLKFNVISYSKAGAVLRMFQEAMGAKTFTKGLNFYLTDMHFKPATPADLHRNLQKAFDLENPGNSVNIDEIMNTWESQASYPMVTVVKSGGNYQLTQERIDGGDEVYTIPISFVTSSDLSFDNKTAKLWMSSKTAEIDGAGSGWILLNIQLTGYYKVKYQKSNWLAIFQTLIEDFESIPSIHRGQVFKDTRELFLDSIIEPVQALELFSYLKDETQKYVWMQFPEIHAVISSHLFGTECFTKYQDFIDSLLQPNLDRLGFDEKTEESAVDADLRSVLSSLSCDNLNRECLEFELRKLQKYLETGEGSYKLCESLRTADESLYKSVLDQTINDENPGQRYGYLYALGCSLDKNHLDSFLQVLIDRGNNLDGFERYYILDRTIGRSVVAMETALEFMARNNTEIYRSITADFYNTLRRATTLINTDKHYNLLMKVLSLLRAQLFFTRGEIESIVSLVDTNMKWIEENYSTMEAWLIDGPVTQTPAASSTTNSPREETTLGAGSVVASLSLLVASVIVKILL